MAVTHATRQPMATSGRCVKTLQWMGLLIALVGILLSIAVVIMSGMHDPNDIRFPGEGLLLLFVGVTMTLLSRCYTAYNAGRGENTARSQESGLDTNIDQPPSYWEVCGRSYDNPVMAPTVITEGGVIIVPTSGLRTISEGVVINVETLQEEFPDEPLPKYEDVVGR